VLKEGCRVAPLEPEKESKIAQRLASIVHRYNAVIRIEQGRAADKEGAENRSDKHPPGCHREIPG